jgi:hypothetical protein
VVRSRRTECDRQSALFHFPSHAASHKRRARNADTSQLAPFTFLHPVRPPLPFRVSTPPDCGRLTRSISKPSSTGVDT